MTVPFESEDRDNSRHRTRNRQRRYRRPHRLSNDEMLEQVRLALVNDQRGMYDAFVESMYEAAEYMTMHRRMMGDNGRGK